MQPLPTRLALVLTALINAVVGLWALLWPTAFHTDFPGVRTGWVAADGPFNEHLLRDFGGLNLALAVTATGALLMATTAAARWAGAAILAFNLPHALYHSLHLHAYPEVIDQVLIASTTWAAAALGLLALLWPTRGTT
ncbi:hypothetical protein [Crossiella cryophila]|uniref:DUF4345 domain-containing protein n=1 Tax=Crossiella cryophila TaxID=43355 RepID=A0A7W7CHF7_9PSEU|nr:hypothetical protein [Crossiella cryophila]MBB4681180.1 hypothetical protein [Crossiella cryophila]